MVCLLFIPATIQIAHAFDSHQEYECCLDGFEQHFHSDDADCALCHLQAEPCDFNSSFSYTTLRKDTANEQFNLYVSYKDCQKLSYTLRGPPAL